MKKLAIVVSAALAGLVSGQVVAATVYEGDAGKLDVTNKIQFQHKFTAHGNHNGVDDSYDRFGAKGKLKLNDTFSAVGQYEGQVNLDTHDGARTVYGTRQLHGGIDAGESGALTVGRHTGAVYNVSGLSDVAPGVLSGYTASSDDAFMGRADNIVQYTNTYNGITFTGQYKFKKDGRSLENHWNTVDEGVGYATSIVSSDINGTGIGFGGAYGTTETSTGKDTSVYSVGLVYDANNVYAAATNTVGKTPLHQKQFHDTEVIAQYKLENGVTPSIGYIDSNQGGKTKAVETGASYAFNKNVTGYVDAGWDTTGHSNNQVKTGIGYSF